MNRLKTISLLLFLLIFQPLIAQPAIDWDQEKIIGRTYIPNTNYKGSPFFINTWISATIHFNSGNVVRNLPIKYDGCIDELVYLDEKYYAMIQIEKSTIKAFEFSNNGQTYSFECRSFKNNAACDHLFQVYYKGILDLLCLRKVDVVQDQAGASGRLLYREAPEFYLYSETNGFRSIKLTKRAFVRIFSRTKRPKCREIIRSNRLNFNDPLRFANAISIAEKNGLLQK